MSFLNLVKGNKNNLQGRVIVYSKLIPYNRCEQHCEDEICPITQGYECIFSLYGTKDKKDFIRNIGVSREMIDILNDEDLDFYGGSISIETEEEILSRKRVDIINAKEHTHPAFCQNAVMAGMNLYIINFLEQSNKKEHNLKEIKSSIKSYRNFKGEEAIRGFIVNHYIFPMLRAKEMGSSDTLRTLQEEFMRFSEGSLFSEDIIALYKHLEGSNEASHILTNQSHIYLDRIVAKHLLKEAIAEERFEDAARLRDKIAKLAQQ